MTLTDTRPEAGAPGTAGTTAAAAPVEHGAVAWIGTVDHKRLGLLFAATGLAALVVGAICAFVFQLPSMGDAPLPFVAPGARLSSAATVATFVIGIPALWIGLATYVVPLQVGGHRLALPRLHNLALWMFVAGGVLSAIGYLADDTRLNSLAANAPAVAAEGEAATNAIELLLAGLAVVAVGTVLAAVTLLVTILNRRAEGVRLRHLPAFPWSVFGVALTLLLSTPVFLAGLVLVYFDQHYGGTLFASGVGGLRIWQHELWLLGRPEALVFTAAGLGLSTDIVATALRRPLRGWPALHAACAAAPLLTFVLWIGATSLLGSPLAPVAAAPSAVLLVPAAVVLLVWLGNVRGSQPRLVPAVLPFLAHLVPLAAALALTIAGAAADVSGPGEVRPFQNGQLVLLCLGVPLLDLAAGLVHWAPKLRGRLPTIATAGLPALLLLAGVLLLALPGYLAGFDAGDGAVVLGIIGAAAIVAGLLALLPTVLGPAGNAPGDPYEGLTLEWAAASPPVRHNFDEIPVVRSPYPLHDARTPTTGGKA